MNAIEKVHCPNCGSQAERHLVAHHLIRTQCVFCDYLMVTCRQTGRVVEAHAPGLDRDHRLFNTQLSHLRRVSA